MILRCKTRYRISKNNSHLHFIRSHPQFTVKRNSQFSRLPLNLKGISVVEIKKISWCAQATRRVEQTLIRIVFVTLLNVLHLQMQARQEDTDCL